MISPDKVNEEMKSASARVLRSRMISELGRPQGLESKEIKRRQTVRSGFRMGDTDGSYCVGGG